MKVKYYIFAALLFLVVFVFCFYNRSEPAPSFKELILLNRVSLTDGEDEFRIRKADSITKISDSYSISLLKEMKLIRGFYIIKSSYLAKGITFNGDTLNLLIVTPGPFIINKSNNKRYGFKKEEKRLQIAKLLFPNQRAIIKE